ncbi:PIN-like domain-containing protein [Acinetobacter sp. ULE_I057]|uniref:PIN-like domain-containing protein n=1 Tax=Acinetobacter sp. ULE_I057 TaxID=3373070 RepID=UPI003AF683CF
MKDVLFSFYNDQTEQNLKNIWKDKKTKFIFDTNILLNIYYYNKDGKAIFFKLLESLGDKAWLPFHVALEYQRNRLKIINDSYENSQKIIKRFENLNKKFTFDEKSIDTILKDFEDFFNKNVELNDNLENFKKLYKEFLEHSQSEFDKISKPIINEINKINSDIIKIDSNDHVRERLDKIFKGEKLGNCLFNNEQELKDFNKDAENRFSNQIPPGYADLTEKGDSSFIFNNYKFFNKYGDLIIFKEILKHARDNKLQNIIFISEEKKEDWRESINTSHQKKILGIRHELKEELHAETGAKNIFIFNQEEFVEYTSQYLTPEVDRESIKNMNKTLEQINSRDLYDFTKNNSQDLLIELEGSEKIEPFTKSQSISFTMFSQLNAAIISHKSMIATIEQKIQNLDFNHMILVDKHKKLLSENLDFIEDDEKLTKILEIENILDELKSIEKESNSLRQQLQNSEKELSKLLKNLHSIRRQINLASML